MTDRILEAFDYDFCHYCHARAGDPCRTPSWHTTKPHKGRAKLSEVRSTSPVEEKQYE